MIIFENSILSLFLFLTFNWLTGWVIACFLSEDEDELFALVLPVSFGLCAFSTLPALFLQIKFFPTSFLFSIACSLIFITIYTFYHKTSPTKIIFGQVTKQYSYIKKNSVLFLAYTLIFIHLLLHQNLVPFYGLGSLPGDWFGHYRLSYELLNHSITEFPMRLPFYQLLQVYYLSMFEPITDFGKNFHLIQLIQVVVAFSFYPIIYLLFKKLFNKQISLVILLFAAFLPYIFVQSVCPWPKLLASTFALMAFYFYLKISAKNSRPRYVWMLGLFCGFSILSHWLGVIYSVCLVANFMFSNNRVTFTHASIKMMLNILLMILLMLSPIYIWGFAEFGIVETIKANISILQKPDYSFAKSIFTRCLNLTTTLFFPLSIVIGLVRELPKAGSNQLAWLDFASRGLSWHFGSIPGNISLTLSIYLFVRLRHRLKAVANSWYTALKDILKNVYQQLNEVDSAVGLFIFGGILMMVILQPVPITSGASLSGLLPSVILIFGITLNYCFRYNSSLILPIILFIECMLVIWFWQGILLYADQNYTVHLQTSNPAIIQLNEVIQYKRDFNLTFLSSFIGNRTRSLLIVINLLIEFSMMGLAIRLIKRRSVLAN